LHLAKGCLIAFRAIAKGYQIPFRENACGIRELHATPIMLEKKENYILSFKKRSKF
jgi:hypothetical protein